MRLPVDQSIGQTCPSWAASSVILKIQQVYDAEEKDVLGTGLHLPHPWLHGFCSLRRFHKRLPSLHSASE